MNLKLQTTVFPEEERGIGVMAAKVKLRRALMFRSKLIFPLNMYTNISTDYVHGVLLSDNPVLMVVRFI